MPSTALIGLRELPIWTYLLDDRSELVVSSVDKIMKKVETLNTARFLCLSKYRFDSCQVIHEKLDRIFLINRSRVVSREHK